ncbi:hypothetical protein PLESTB_001355400 [Pleodorina starrii]|uniref:Coatomer subunit delta n=1 Tax=Pleodorina starrii TaxID=330485 RepID=A0A9W6F6L2_9CHLO|nr:hypothetical protein PLESTM_001915200 [Pleodorina starrii]GLC58407.1 hypothetical protein PLESTB_001355400 [Pleodorina starrii]GLC76470.1 hypothetical protein PLESTF_001784800 [Pleodorina starrii]
MVFAREAAVIVKGRDGRTVLLQSRGLNFQVANQAAGEAMAALQAAAQGEPNDILSSSQATPLLSGRLEVMQGRLAVTYRVAGALIFLLVSQPAANVFSCVALLNSVVRLVSAPLEGKAGEMTPERLQKRFGEVYLAVDALLTSGGVLEANGAMGRALGTLEQLHEKEKEKEKGKGGPEAPRTPPPQQRPGGGGRRATRRTLQDVIDNLALLSFSAGSAMQGVQPRPGFQLPEEAAATAPRKAPGAGPLPLQGAVGPGGSIDLGDDIFGLGGKKAETPGKPKLPPGADPNDPFAASDVDWTSFGGDKKDAATPPAAAKSEAKAAVTGEGRLGFEDDAFGDAAFAAAPAPAPAPMVPSEPVLRLGEVWRGEAAGGRLVRAGLSGRVEWVSEGAKSKVHTVQFMVQVPESSSEHVAAALTTARRHPGCCRAGPVGGVLVADGILAKPHPGAPLLTYHLPPPAMQPPLQAQLGASCQATQDGRRLVTLGLHYAICPRVAPRAADLAVEVVVPALLERPLRASPPGAVFDATSRTLRWQQPGPVASLDNSGTATQPFVASFVVGEVTGVAVDEAALAAALGRLSAKLTLRGADGSGTLSGAALAQGVVELEWTPSLCEWRAEMTATP